MTDGPAAVIRDTTHLFPADTLLVFPQEPVVANSGDLFFCTGNVFAGMSENGGRNWTFLDPTTWNSAESGAVCCDQIVEYVPEIDRFIWIMQFDFTPGTTENRYRIAFATPAEVRARTWGWVDFTASSLGQPGMFLDFPDLAVSGSHLYLSYNIFADTSASAMGAGLLRIPLSSFASNDFSLGNRIVTRMGDFCFKIASHTGSVARWATTSSSSEIQIYAWDESSTQVSHQLVPVATYESTNYLSVCPNDADGTGRNWLNRTDARMTGAAFDGTSLWLAWTCGRNVDRVQPYVRLVRYDLSSGKITLERDYHHPDYAFAYPSLCTNSLGEVGITMAIGGKTKLPGVVVGLVSGTDTLVIVREGTHGPNNPGWGDYWHINRYYPDPRLFVVAAYTQEGGRAAAQGMTRFIVFGREPITHVESPNGGEQVNEGETLPIRWSAAGGSAFVGIQLSRDDGATWEILAGGTPNDGSFDWTITGPVTPAARIRIVNPQDTFADDVSDFPFAILGIVDAYEPDETVHNAKTLNQDLPQFRSIHAGGNIDLARIVLAESVGLKVKAITYEGPGLLQMRLHNADGKDLFPIGSAVVESGAEREAELRFNDVPPGTYYVMIEDVGRDQPIGVYGLNYSVTSGDTYEPDDDIQSASRIRSGETQQRSFHLAESLNPDFAYFELTETGDVQIETAPGSAGLDTTLVLRNTNEQVVATDDDGGYDQYSRITAYNLFPGRYTIQVEAKSPGIRAYELSLNVTASTGPSAPVLQTPEFVSGPTRVRLTWSDTALNEAGIEVWRSTDKKKYFLMQQLGAHPGTGTMTFEDTSVQPDETYTYYIFFYNPQGTAESQRRSITIPPQNGLGTPGDLRAIPLAEKAILLMWIDRSTAETGFRVDRATVQAGPYRNVGTPKAVAGSGGTVAHLDTKQLAANKTYYYRVTAVHRTGASNAAHQSAKTFQTGKNAILSPISHSFTTRIGTPVTKDFVISNPLPVAFQVGIGTLRAPYSSTLAGTTKTVNPGQQLTVPVKFSPTGTRKAAATLKFTPKLGTLVLGTFNAALSGVGSR